MFNSHIFKWLRESGGSRDAAVNGSITPVLFEYTSLEDTTELTRLIVSIVDSNTFEATQYGSRILLPNGLKVELIDAQGAVILDLLDGEVIHSNAEWQAMCFDWHYNSVGVGDNVAVARWTLEKAGEPLYLKVGEKFRVTVQDDLTGLTSHYFQLQGIQY